MATYDEIGIGYDETRKADPYITSRIIHYLQIEDEGSYLDVACGTGNYAIAINSQTKAAFYGIDAGMNYMLNITADGSWTVTIEQPRPTSAPSLPQSYSGNGCRVSSFFYSSGGLAYFNMSHNGSSNFIIWLLDKDGQMVDLLANEIGSYSGSKAVNLSAGIYILSITADGSWNISISK